MWSCVMFIPHFSILLRLVCHLESCHICYATICYALHVDNFDFVKIFITSLLFCIHGLFCRWPTWSQKGQHEGIFITFLFFMKAFSSLFRILPSCRPSAVSRRPAFNEGRFITPCHNMLRHKMLCHNMLIFTKA